MILTRQVRTTALYTLLEKWWSHWPGADINSLPKLDPNVETAALERGTDVLERSQQLVSLLQVYILPLFYGLLGAYAFVLRELIEETRNRTYREEANTGYYLRVFLGLLAGLAIGWFAKPNADSSELLGKLTPFALSFVAGYSVEVLFALLDKFVSAFSGAGDRAQARL